MQLFNQMLNLISGSSQSENSLDKAIENNGLLSTPFSDSFQQIYSDFVITRQPPEKIDSDKAQYLLENLNSLEAENVFNTSMGGKDLPIWFSMDDQKNFAQLPGFRSELFTEQEFASLEQEDINLSTDILAAKNSTLGELEGSLTNTGDEKITHPYTNSESSDQLNIQEGQKFAPGLFKATSDLLFAAREELSSANIPASESIKSRAGDINVAWSPMKNPIVDGKSITENAEKNSVVEQNTIQVKTKFDKETSGLASNLVVKDKSEKNAELEALVGAKNEKTGLKKGQFLERNRMDVFAQKINAEVKTSELQFSEKQSGLDNLATLAKSGSMLLGQPSSQIINQGSNSVTHPSNYAITNQQVSGIHSSESITELKGASSTDFNQGLNIKSRFAPDLSVRIQWMMRQSLSSAEILMDPPELGPMTVKVQQNNGELNLFFQVNNANTKDALDENMSRLKDLLEEQGLALGDTQVKQEENKSKNSESEEEGADSLMAQSDEEQNTDKVTEHELGSVDLYT